MSKKNKLDVFVDEFSKMINAYNLNDWDVSYRMKPLKNDQANIQADPMNRVARITLSSYCEDHNIRRVARHEAAHLFLSMFRYMGRNRYATEEQLDSEEERLCTVLEKWTLD